MLLAFLALTFVTYRRTLKLFLLRNLVVCRFDVDSGSEIEPCGRTIEVSETNHVS